MVGLAEAAAALSSLSAAMDVAKGIQALDANTKVKLATIDLMEKILSAQQHAFASQQAQAELQSRIKELEGKLASLEGWEIDKNRYHLHRYPAGAVVYVLKDGDEADEPSHCLCPACFENSRKSILQHRMLDRGGEDAACPACGAEFKLVKRGPPPPIRVYDF
ncbi:hypothetical protein [Sphingomonas koreensis]